MKNLRGRCTGCGGVFSFPAHQVGTVGTCPHCGQATELMLEVPRMEPAVPRRIWVWSGVALAIVVLGCAGTLIAFKRAQRLAARHGGIQSAGGMQSGQLSEMFGGFVFETNGFLVTSIRLVRQPGAPLPHAVGAVSNALDRPRVGVKLQLDLRDLGGRTVGVSQAGVVVIGPHAFWEFRAVVLQTNAVGAAVAFVQEER